MLRGVTIAGVWVALFGLLGLLAWGVFRVSAADSVGSGAGGPTRVNWEGRAIALRVRPAPDLHLALFEAPGGVAGATRESAGSATRPPPAAADGAAAPGTSAGARDARSWEHQAELRLSALAGQPVVVNFWASWCQPCREEAAVLERFAQEYGPRGVAFVGVNVWDNEDKARTFLAEYGISYLNGVDLAGGAAIDYGLTGLPETFFIDRDGRLVRKFIGPITERALRAAVEELLS